MSTFFHVDRCRSLRPRKIIELVHYYDIKPKDFQEHANLLFPKGFSRHGRRYFVSSEIKIEFEKYEIKANCVITTKNCANAIIEILFEYMRRSYFPDKPSRFQSFHALQSLDDAKKFRKNYFNSRGIIWEVGCDNTFKADMNFLKLEGSLLELSFRVHRYWSGQKGEQEPFWEFLLTPPVRIIKSI